jgi:hypothetical protein
VHKAQPPAAAALFAVRGTVAWHDAKDTAAKDTAAQRAPAAQAVTQPTEQLTPQAGAPLAAPVEGDSQIADAVDARRVSMFPELAPHEGLLSLDTRPWSTVYLGKQLLGTTPLIGVIVPRGDLTLKLVDAQGRVYTRTVLESDEQTRRAFYDFEPSPNDVQ